jgi:glycosyltransferase involved in cell wall biosynthesis
VFHATENYFEMDGLAREFLGRLRRTIELSDLTVAVSSGVARSIAEEVQPARVAEVTNGCDFSFYAGARPDDQLRSQVGPIAIYAGNINSRLDFELLDRTARTRPDLMLVFVGPTRGLDRDDTRAWKLLLALPNVRHLGTVEPERLPGLYAASDLGLLPYKRTPLLVRNGFPLKALEMAATGLPVVSTRLEPLVGLARAIDVTEDDEGFLAATHITRDLISDEERSELIEVARRNDYAEKFAQVRGLVEAVAERPPTPGTSLAALQARWREHSSSRPTVWAAALAHRGRIALVELVLRLPEDLRERVPVLLRRMLTRLLSPS